MKKRLIGYSDKELQALAGNGNQMAFEVIFDRYWKPLYRYAYSIYQDEEVCEDIVQELFIDLWNKMPSATILHLESYLLKAIKYKVINHIRSLKFTQEHLDILETISIPSKTMDDIEYKDFEKTVINHINKLSPKCKEVFILSRFEYYSNTEIAIKLNISLLTVEKHISNALKYLRNNFDDYQLSAFVIGMFFYC
ncbi:RNA polymerase sigma-70 factor [Flavobacterium agrisoli]|uniref:RNA polymerase sigma-70 factor n=1 Tax=Flavobacterium agrisoli TaxID=2793066 RepID=A0A934PKY1_9FLAO|nr:RNA polymerase sigma-70 factor [Flavobacterium agrisoli]MBK0369190.1 RNA polymerase sigma-70 factor [Flavobacterium agrisoli]